METPNINYIIQLSDGDLDFQNELISIIKREFPEEVKLFNSHALSRDFSDLADCVHKLKHKISLMGLKCSYGVANQYEEELRKGINLKQKDFETILHKISVFLRTI